MAMCSLNMQAMPHVGLCRSCVEADIIVTHCQLVS
jgi:hypothetical protein